MALLPWILLTLLPFEAPVQEGSKPDATEFMRQGQYFMAESIWLGSEPETIFPTAGQLSRVALRIGNLEEKQAFYKTYLTKSPQWRGVALYVLASLAAHQGDYDRFRANGRLFLQEFNPEPHPLKYRLLYHMARYTAQPAGSLNLRPEEAAWFEACRKLPANRTLPDIAPPNASNYLKYGGLLDATQSVTVPEELDAAEFLAGLLTIQQALNSGDDHTAAITINQLSAMDQTLVPQLEKARFYGQLAQFFRSRDQEMDALSMEQVAARMIDQSVLPLVIRPDHLIRTLPDTAPTEATQVPTDETAEGDTFPLLEELVRAKQRNLDLRIKALTPKNTYEKIYRNYLLGLLYLEGGRLTSAYERLRLAEQLIHDYPFPILETKILIAVGRYFEMERNQDKAEWYLIQAIQVWNAPEHLPVFVGGDYAVPESPYAVLLDRAFSRPRSNDSIHQILYYSESAHFQNLRRRAYDRNVISSNLVVGNQLGQIGDQLVSLVKDLAAKSRDTAPPMRYNQALQVWNQLWEKTNPFYLDASVPSVKQIQRALNNRDRVLSFIEGHEQLGVLVISKDQAFPLNLGLKSRYLALNSEERFAFLESRLGPVWKHDGKLILTFSKTFRKDGFMEMLKSKVQKPDQVVLPFSLKSFAAQKEAPECGNYAVFNQLKSQNATRVLDRVPRSDWFDKSGRDQVAAALESHDHLIFCGPVQLDDDGLTLGADPEGFQIHEAGYYNPNLCSMVLVVDEIASWAPVLDELELVNPHSAMGLILSRDLNTLTKLDFDKNKGQGVRIY